MTITALPRDAGTTPAVTDRDLSTAMSWIVVATVVAGALNYLYVLVMAHLLPATQFVPFSSVQALLLIAGTMANAAVPWLLSAELAKRDGDGDAQGSVLWFALVANVVLGVLVGAGIAAAAGGFANGTLQVLIVASAIGYFVASTTMGLFQGQNRARMLAYVVVAEVAAKVVIGVVWVKAGGGANAAIGASALGAVVVVAMGIRPMTRLIRPSHAALRVAKLWRGVGGMMMTQGLLTVLTVSDVVVLATLNSDHASATSQYQLAATLGRIPIFFALAVSLATYPALARSPHDSAVPSRALTATLTIGMPIAIAVATLPSALLNAVGANSYGSITRFLPYVAVTGLAWTVVTFEATRLRAAGAYLRCIALLLGGTTAVITGGVVGLGADGVVGVAVGTAAAAVATAAVLIGCTERRWPASHAIAWRGVALAVISPACLIAVHPYAAVWLVVAIASLAAAGLLAFGPGHRRRVPLGVAA